MTAAARATTLVVFGASGDLTRRKLGPALYRLCAKGRLPENIHIVGFARTDWQDEEFREFIHQGVREFGNGYDEETPTPNVLSICVQPDEGVHLSFDAKVPDHVHEVQSVDLEFHYRSSFPNIVVGDAYERLLLDAIKGDASLFARSDEIEAAWRLIDPILAAWEGTAGLRLGTYASGSWGPVEGKQLLAREGRSWRIGCGHHG